MPLDGPFFVAPVKSENSGVDFLALGAVGERLIAAGLPGITNATRYLRAYTFAGWVAWQFNENLKALGRRGEALPAHQRTLLKAFREKAELMFTWCNKEVIGAVGNSRRYPELSEPLTLTFSNEKFANPRSGAISQASWFAAAAYGPSFSKENGLGYLATYRSVYIPTELGEKAARILDNLMAQHPAAHQRISDLTNHKASLRDVKALENALRLDATTAKERALFRDTFYPEGKVGEWDMMHGNRATTIALILAALTIAEPLDVEQIRRSIALGITPDGGEIDDANLQRMRRVWFSLSLRQLERVALERLLRWLELKLFKLLYHWCDVRVLCDHLKEELQESWPEAAEQTVGYQLDRLRRRVERAKGIQRAPLSNSTLSQFDLRDELELLDNTPEVPGKAIYALLLCTAVTELCDGNEDLTDMLKMGGRERVSLLSLSRFARSRGDKTIGEFAQDVLTHLVYGQHLHTAATRVEEGKNKFRFALDDSGLRPLIHGDSVNAQLGTPDRILHALYLMEECDLVRADDEGRYSRL